MILKALSERKGSRTGLAMFAVAWGFGCGDSMTMAEPAPAPNRPPVAVGTLPATTMAIGESISLNVSTYFQDPDGDALTYRAESTDPSRASATISGTDLTITGIAGGTATVTVIATDPGRLIAQQSGGVTVMEENRAPTAVGVISRQTMDAGTSLTVDVSSYFADPDGDALSFEATSNNTAVVTVDVSGSVVTINAVADGTATVSVSATDPDGLSTAQEIEIVVGRESGDFRDDFDSDELAGWDLTNAGAALPEGVLQLTNTSSGLPWTGRSSARRGTCSTGRSAPAWGGFTTMLARAWSPIRGPRSYRLSRSRSGPASNGGGRTRTSGYWSWGRVATRASGRSSAPGIMTRVSDSAGSFTEIRLSLKGAVLSASVGDTTVYMENLTGARISLRQLPRVGLWAVPLGDAAERMALFDWVEVTGETSSAAR